MVTSQMDLEELDLALERYKSTSDKQSCQDPIFNRLRFSKQANL